MLHKPLVHRNMSEHVTCLFLEFENKQNLWAVGQMARTDRRKQEREPRGNKAQSR